MADDLDTRLNNVEIRLFSIEQLFIEISRRVVEVVGQGPKTKFDEPAKISSVAVTEYDYAAEFAKGDLCDRMAERIANSRNRTDLDQVADIIRVHHFRQELTNENKVSLRAKWLEKQKAIANGVKS